MSISLDKIFGLHADALLLRSKRSEMLASNLVNADTPQYKAVDFDLRAALDQSSMAVNAVTLDTTDKQHISLNGNSLPAVRTQYRIPQQPALDGNTVDTQIEKSLFAENSVRYQISLGFLDGKIKNIINALNVDA